MKYPAVVDERSLARLHASYVIEPTGCWRWIRATTTAGYGHFHWGGAYYQAHRFLYTLTRGAVSTTAMDHLCRNRWCVNPDHLEPVTYGENTRRGLCARLNAERVAGIHEARARGLSYRAIARAFGVDHSTVSRVLNGQRWPEYAPRRKAA